MNICRICGRERGGIAFDGWVRRTFMDWDKLQPGNIICDDCLFWFDESSEELAELVGKEKPQRMRNYSHFIVNGTWIPLSKGDKVRMRDILLNSPFPELAVVASSGQKHIAFRATHNPAGSTAGWVQFEEQSLWIEPADLAHLLDLVEALYLGFSKTEIESGDYKQHRINKFGIEAWYNLEAQIAKERGGLLFALALFLAQKPRKGKSKHDDGGASKGRRPACVHLAGGPGGVQKPLSDDDLAAIRGSGEERGVHEQSREVCQLPLL